MLVPVGAGTSLEVEDVGHGPVVVLLHGWPVTTLHWRSVVPALVQAGYRTLAIEARGLGSTSTGRGDHEKATLAREVTSVLDAMQIGRYAVVGHDWGGTIAVLMAAERPQRIAAIVIEESVTPGLEELLPDSDDYPDWHLPLFQAPDGVAERLLAGRHDAVVDAFLDGSAGPSRLDFDAHVAYLSAYAGDEHLKSTLALYRARDRDAAAVRRATQRLLRVPGLAIGGRFAMGGAVAEAMSRSVARVHTMVVDDAGHYPAEQSPDRVNAALIPFLRAA